MIRRWTCAWALTTICSAAACGCGSGSAQAPVGWSSDDPDPSGVDVALRASDGTAFAISQLRGRPVLLFLFATFDGVSQASLRPLSRFARHNSNVHVVGIAVQPDARVLLGLWVSALTPPFTVGYEQEETIAQGTSELGAIEAVPTFLLLDGAGRIRARHVGYATDQKLERMLDETGLR